MLLILSALIVAAAVLIAAQRVAGTVAAARPARDGAEPLHILRLFAAGMAAAERDPRALLVWQPLAVRARGLYPEAFAAIDRAGDARFPFTPGQIEAAHARWTTEWLAWERAHDGEYKLKAAVLEDEIASGASRSARNRLEAVEREKLETYQRRYEEYIQVARALQALTKP